MIAEDRRWNDDSQLPLAVLQHGSNSAPGILRTATPQVCVAQSRRMFVHPQRFSARLIVFVLFVFTLATSVPVMAQDAPPSSTQTSSPYPSTDPTPTGAPSLTTSSSTPATIVYDTQPLPADPAAALLLASKANSLGGEGLEPWYLKAHDQTYDAQGKLAAREVFELYWVAKDHYRVSYMSDAFTQTIRVMRGG